MKRDMTLIREILLKLEAKEDSHPALLAMNDVPAPQLAYHLQIMTEAGLIQAEDMGELGGGCFLPMGLTWAGQEWLALCQHAGHWQAAMDLMQERESGLSLLGLQHVLTRLHLQNLTTKD